MYERMVLVDEDVEVTVIKRNRRWENARDFNKKTRLYVDLNQKDLGMERPPYGSQQGDGSPEDKAWKAYNKLELDAMREYALQAKSLLEHRLHDVISKVEFSRFAGCTCPCSPGFVVTATRGPLKLDELPVDVYVKYVG